MLIVKMTYHDLIVFRCWWTLFTIYIGAAYMWTRLLHSLRQIAKVCSVQVQVQIWDTEEQFVTVIAIK